MSRGAAAIRARRTRGGYNVYCTLIDRFTPSPQGSSLRQPGHSRRRQGGYKRPAFRASQLPAALAGALLVWATISCEVAHIGTGSADLRYLDAPVEFMTIRWAIAGDQDAERFKYSERGIAGVPVS